MSDTLIPPETDVRQQAVIQLVAGVGGICDPDSVSIGLERMGWTVHAVRYQGRIAGAILEKGGEFHISIAPEFQKRWNPRPYIRSILYPALDEYGVIYSDVKIGDYVARRWLEKLGFRYFTEDQENICYELRDKKYT